MTKHSPPLFAKRLMMCGAVIPAAVLGTLASPASAADPVNAAPWQAQLVARAQGELRSFYAYRSGPLWVTPEGAPTPAAKSLLQLVETAQYDGLDPAAIGQAELVAAIADLEQAPSALSRAHAEVTFSRVFVAYVKDLRDTSHSQMVYEHELLRPFVPEAFTTLEEAAAAPSLDDYVRGMRWMHPLYAQLRQALIAGQPVNGSVLQVAQANLERLRALPATPGQRYVLIDAASARLWMYEGDHAVDSMKVVVGKAETQTPIMAGYLRYAVFNPYWNVPTDLIRRTIAPRARAQGQAYLRRGGYQIVSEWTSDAEVLAPSGIDWKAVEAGQAELKVRQLPGGTNAMGKVKYEFPNPQGIYLHDTPDKALMLEDARQFSNGCIRLEDAARLGRWLMQGALPEVSSSPEQRVDLPVPVPIYVTYLTARPEGDQLAVGRDPYGLDAAATSDLAVNTK